MKTLGPHVLWLLVAMTDHGIFLLSQELIEGGDALWPMIESTGLMQKMPLNISVEISLRKIVVWENVYKFPC